MAAIALVHLRWPTASGYLRVFLSSDFLRNHVEVHHVVTRRRLVALGAVERAWRRMLEFSNSPTGCCVALGALLAEQAHVLVFGQMTSGAVEGFARRTLVELAGDSNAQPRFHRLECGCAGGVMSRRARKCPRSDLGQFHVVHDNGRDVRTLVLDVTCCALPDAGVERGRLTAEQSFVVRMAVRALSVGNAGVRLVARLAALAQVSVAS